MIQAIVATRILPANTRSSKRACCGLFQRANDGGPFRQVLRKRWRSFSPGTALGSPGTALGAIVAVPVHLVQRGRMLSVPRLRTLEPVLPAGGVGCLLHRATMSSWLLSPGSSSGWFSSDVLMGTSSIKTRATNIGATTSHAARFTAGRFFICALAAAAIKYPFPISMEQ